LERGPILLLVLGLVTIAAGVLRFIHLGHFTLVNAGYCVLAIPAALLLLLVSDYTLHHARIVFVMVLAMLALLAIASPSFCVGLGAALAGIVLTQWRR
jgi:hypothetical protein